MADILDFANFNNKAEKFEEEDHYDKQTRLLNVLEEEYPLGGIVIALTEEGVHMSVAVDDYATAKNALLSAIVQFLEGRNDDFYSE